MSDYTKLHVDAVVTGLSVEEIEDKIKELRPGSSYYHATGTMVKVNKDEYFPENVEVMIMCQTKYGRGQSEFLDWLEPHVCQGVGTHDIWAMQFDEFFDKPTIRSLRKLEL